MTKYEGAYSNHSMCFTATSNLDTSNNLPSSVGDANQPESTHDPPPRYIFPIGWCFEARHIFIRYIISGGSVLLAHA